jgi:hypothetical protein
MHRYHSHAPIVVPQKVMTAFDPHHLEADLAKRPK